HVTGVQTCALPILFRSPDESFELRELLLERAHAPELRLDLPHASPCLFHQSAGRERGRCDSWGALLGAFHRLRLLHRMAVALGSGRIAVNLEHRTGMLRRT